MAHSLSHALMSEVAIDCGYPASALKERIYVLPRSPGEAIRCGVLIYTASAGNQGTLGGLVEVTQRFGRICVVGSVGVAAWTQQLSLAFPRRARAQGRAGPGDALYDVAWTKAWNPRLRPLHLVVRETEFCGLRLAGYFRRRMRENSRNSVRRPRCASLTRRNYGGFCLPGNRPGLSGLHGGGRSRAKPVSATAFV